MVGTFNVATFEVGHVFAVTEGTGRFAGATGNGTWDVPPPSVFDPATGSGSGAETIRGRITAPRGIEAANRVGVPRPDRCAIAGTSVDIAPDIRRSRRPGRINRPTGDRPGPVPDAWPRSHRVKGPRRYRPWVTQ